MIAGQLRALGVAPGEVLIVHAAFSRVRLPGPPPTRPLELIDALRDVLGPAGTLVMPSMADTDDLFDPETSPCRGMGVVADTFWRQPGVLRVNSPHAFAAEGPRAAEITRDQPWDTPHGPDSPVGRVHALDGRVLLLGVGHDANTTVHLAEELAQVPYGVAHEVTLVEAGREVKRSYREPDHCCRGFARLDRWLGARQVRGPVGAGEARLARSRDIVDEALAHLRADPLVFLHEPGDCDECDDARATL